jgi:hypothetical protein
MIAQTTSTCTRSRGRRATYRDTVLRVAQHIDIVVCRGAQHQGVVVREIRARNRTPGYSQRLQASHCEPHTTQEATSVRQTCSHTADVCRARVLSVRT